MAASYAHALWEASKQTPLWRRIGFTVFNLGGFSVASLGPWFDFLTGVQRGYLYLLWFSVLLLLGSGSWIVGKRAWEKVERERACLVAQREPHLAVVFDPTCQGCRTINIRHHDGSTRPTVRLCIGVANTADVPAENVSVYVTALSDRRVPVPVALRRSQDTGWQGRVPQPQVAPVTLNPSGVGHQEHFVLVAWRHGDMFADFFPANEASAVSIEARDLTGEIVVSNKAAPVSKRFFLDADHMGLSILRLEEKGEPG